MIGKHIKMRSPRKSSAKRLTEYLLDPKNFDQRVGTVRVTNCYSDDPEFAVLEMLNTQRCNTRTTIDKTYHLLISFAQEDELNDTQLSEIESFFCEKLGYKEHQRICVAHHDTDNVHMHVVINKIHPTRYTAHDPFRDFHTLAKASQECEKRYNLKFTNHEPKKSPSQNSIDDMERNSGIESLATWIKRNCADAIARSDSWQALHAALDEFGIEIQLRGNGLIFSDEKVHVKASTVDRKFSKKRLEDKLGSFEPKKEKHISKQTDSSRNADSSEKPDNLDTSEDLENSPQKDSKPSTTSPSSTDDTTSETPLIRPRYTRDPRYPEAPGTLKYKQYKNYQQHRSLRKKELIDDARKRHRQRIEAAKRWMKLRRSAIKIMKGRGVHSTKKILFAQASFELRQRIKIINNDYRKEIGLIHSNSRLLWSDWLQEKAAQGDMKALDILRRQKEHKNWYKNFFSSYGESKEYYNPADDFDHVTKNGTVFYKSKGDLIRDDGTCFAVKDGAKDATVLQALEFAVARFGTSLEVKGSDAFKQQVVSVLVTNQSKFEGVRLIDTSLEAQRMAYPPKNRQKRGRFRM